MRIEMVLVAVLVVSCGDVPREGDKCTERVCDYAADGRILECMDGHLRAFDCNGGCRMDGSGAAFCDPRGATPGDTCPPELGGKTLALAKLKKGITSAGQELQVVVDGNTRSAVVVATPVYDPERKKVRS